MHAQPVNLYVCYMCRQAQLKEDQKRVLDERVAALWKERASLMEQIKVGQCTACGGIACTRRHEVGSFRKR